MVEIIAGWIVAAIAATGYPGILGLMAIESACIPLPSEVIMPFAGYLASTGRLDLWLVATAGALGCNLGSHAAYELGRLGGRRAIIRYGRWVLLSEEDLDRAERFFQGHGGLAVLIGRLLPGIRSFIALPAGIARMPLLRFHVLTFLGSWPWCFGLAYLGKALGTHWRTNPLLRSIISRADIVIATLALFMLLWFIWRRVRASR